MSGYAGWFCFLLVVALVSSAISTATGQVGASFGWWPRADWVANLVGGWMGNIVGYGGLGAYLVWAQRRANRERGDWS